MSLMWSEEERNFMILLSWCANELSWNNKRAHDVCIAEKKPRKYVSWIIYQHSRHKPGEQQGINPSSERRWSPLSSKSLPQKVLQKNHLRLITYFCILCRMCESVCVARHKADHKRTPGVALMLNFCGESYSCMCRIFLRNLQGKFGLLFLGEMQF